MQRVILITGASSGIGKAIALAAAREGYQVVATMRQPAEERDYQDFPNIFLLPLDVTIAASREAAVTMTVQKYGRIDVLVNNAGFGVVGAFEDSDTEAVEREFAVNVFGVLEMTRAVLPIFRKQHAGTIVTITSMGGRLTFPLYSIYHASKWAVEGFFESLAYEVASFGIRIKLIEPGIIRTNFYGRSQVDTGTTTSPYAKLKAVLLPRYQEAGINGSDPGVVASMTLRAINDRSGRLRYPVGQNAQVLLTLRRFLPERVFHFLLGRMLGVVR